MHSGLFINYHVNRLTKDLDDSKSFDKKGIVWRKYKKKKKKKKNQNNHGGSNSKIPTIIPHYWDNKFLRLILSLSITFPAYQFVFHLKCRISKGHDRVCMEDL